MCWKIIGYPRGTEVPDTRAFTRQRDPVKNDWLRVFKKMTMHGESPDSIFAGAGCFAIFTRARWVDAQNFTSRVELDTLDDSRSGFPKRARPRPRHPIPRLREARSSILTGSRAVSEMNGGPGPGWIKGQGKALATASSNYR